MDTYIKFYVFSDELLHFEQSSRPFTSHYGQLITHMKFKDTPCDMLAIHTTKGLRSYYKMLMTMLNFCHKISKNHDIIVDHSAHNIRHRIKELKDSFPFATRRIPKKDKQKLLEEYYQKYPCRIPPITFSTKGKGDIMLFMEGLAKFKQDFNASVSIDEDVMEIPNGFVRFLICTETDEKGRLHFSKKEWVHGSVEASEAAEAARPWRNHSTYVKYILAKMHKHLIEREINYGIR